MANGVGCTATMGADNGGKDGRELEEWRDIKRGGQAMLGMPGIGRGVLETRVSGSFLSAHSPY